MHEKTDPAALLRSHGLHVTAQRLAVLNAVCALPHCTAASVTERVRAAIGSVSQQAVYDALGVLTDRGLLRRVQPAGSPALFDPRVGDEHHHAICRKCQAVVDVDLTVDRSAAPTVAGASGYEIEEVEILFWGTCPKCLAEAPAPGT